ncbi:MAG: glycyl-radical enzyme activating protein [Phycisphaerae bacterium]|jgi:pyruvate formate lyase activating enzyme|nr:glycyl-radical enzyme activating protein [Phycisphaerae bacterium]
MIVNSTDAVTGRIFDIKKFALHDGPGIRTTVFCKGCPLSCVWCHNPESMSPGVELSLSVEKCIGCGTCVDACPNDAMRIDKGACTCDRELCVRCGKCVDGCFAGALEMIGRQVSVEDVMIEVRKDAPFYRTSGGGVTISGGEPLMQSDFTTAILQQCRAEGFHTALDTSGQGAWESLQAAAEHADLVLYDLKVMDPAAHEKHTGVSNDLILENLRRLCALGTPVEIRMPIIPAMNDSAQDIDTAGEFISGLDNIVGVRLLAYHRLAAAKYERIGRDNPAGDLKSPDANHLAKIAERLTEFSLTVMID